MDRSNRRRWLISAAVVVLIHVCIAGAVLTWRHMNAPAPILVDLTPAPSVSQQSGTLPASEQPSPQQTTPQQNTQPASASASASAPVDDHAAPPPPTEPTAPNETAASAEPNTGPAGASAGVNTQQLSPAARNTEAENGAGGIGTNSAVPGPLARNPASAGAAPTRPLPNSPMANMPLDTSITVQPPLHGNAGVAPFGHGEVGPLASRDVGSEGAPSDQRPTSIFRPAKPFGVPDVPRNSLLPNGNPVLSNNTLSVPGIGLGNVSDARVQDRARAATARLAARSQTTKNSIGSSVIGIAVPNSALRNGLTNGTAANSVGSLMTAIASRGDATVNSGDSATRNAIGVTANFRPRIPRVAIGDAKPGMVAVAGHDMPHAPVINGRDLVRPLGGPGVIGGPARRAGAGMLSGSDFHLRRP